MNWRTCVAARQRQQLDVPYSSKAAPDLVSLFKKNINYVVLYLFKCIKSTILFEKKIPKINDWEIRVKFPQDKAVLVGLRLHGQYPGTAVPLLPPEGYWYY